MKLLSQVDFQQNSTLPESTKSLIRHILTAVGTIIALLGLTEWTALVDIFSTNLDPVWAAINTVVGFVMAVVGFFQNRSRLGGEGG